MRLIDAGVVFFSLLTLASIPPANLTAVELTQDTRWSGTTIVNDTVVVPAGIVLTVEPGTVVAMKESAAIKVLGQCLANGTATSPIRFTRYAAGTRWKQIMFVEAADSRLAYCTFEYANCAGDHQDYYDPAQPRNYHEVVVVLASHVDFEGCVFQRLQDASGKSEGDAIAVIADDLYYPGAASANVRSCKFLSIGQGVHTRYSRVLVEDCYFQGKTGDNDDVDLYGESTPPCVVRHNLFDIPCEDDRIHPTLCSAIIDGNVIKGGTDHGIVLRDRASPVVTNNIISNCLNGGIAVENSCTALVVNNTIVNCSRGIRLFDLGRWDHPYHLNPGGGTATVVNCIIWDCPQSMTLADTPNMQVEDRGSHVTAQYCDIKGGRASVSVSGANSTVIWGQGNINIDPQFADLGKKDFHLKSQVGRWDPTSQSWVRDRVTSPCIDTGDPNDANWRNEPWPHGGRINMGTYGGTPQASMSTNTVGYVADLDGNLIVDVHDFAEFALYWRIHRRPGTSDRSWSAGDVSVEPPWAADLNHDGNVDFHDLAVLGEQWLTGAEQP